MGRYTFTLRHIMNTKGNRIHYPIRIRARVIERKEWEKMEKEGGRQYILKGPSRMFSLVLDLTNLCSLMKRPLNPVPEKRKGDPNHYSLK